MIKWLRTSNSGMALATLIRLYLGFTWLTSGMQKITSVQFSSQGMVTQAIKEPVTNPAGQPAYGWYNSFLDSIVQPNISLFDFLVQYGELLIGIGLIVGAFTTSAAFFGLALNFTYLLAGSISINPLFVFLGFIILISGYNPGKIGLDHWIIPFLRHKFSWLEKSVN